MLSLRLALPDLPVVAALSANHLAALILPAHLRRLYIAVDNDEAGMCASNKLADRAETSAIEAIRLFPHGGDFNEDLCALGIEALRAHLRPQLAPEDVARLLPAFEG
jgi:DNA primase